MSHQTTYKSKFTEMKFVTKAMQRLGFKIQGVPHTSTLTCHKDGCHTVHVNELNDNIVLSSDFDWGSGSREVSKIVGGREFENVATFYNEAQLQEHFEDQGYEVESETLESGEVRMLVTLGE